MRLSLLAALAILTPSCNGFVVPAPAANTRIASSAISMTQHENSSESNTRRSVLSSFFTSAVAITAGASSAFAEAETLERGGVKLTPFNSLAFNYREGGSPALDAASLDEPSVPYAEFLEKLDADQVEFVKFLAPNGDAAYATFKATAEGESKSTPIRIGEGYPTEDPEGWSSPAFVIKAVAKKNVPYKFVVPGLGDSFM